MDITEDWTVIASQNLHPRKPYFFNLLCKVRNKELTSVKMWLTLIRRWRNWVFMANVNFVIFFHVVFNIHGSLSNKKARVPPFFQIRYLPKSLESNYLLYNTCQMLLFERSCLYHTGGSEDHPCLFILASVEFNMVLVKWINKHCQLE